MTDDEGSRDAPTLPAAPPRSGAESPWPVPPPRVRRTRLALFVAWQVVLFGTCAVPPSALWDEADDQEMLHIAFFCITPHTALFAFWLVGSMAPACLRTAAFAGLCLAAEAAAFVFSENLTRGAAFRACFVLVAAATLPWALLTVLGFRLRTTPIRGRRRLSLVKLIDVVAACAVAAGLTHYAFGEPSAENAFDGLSFGLQGILTTFPLTVMTAPILLVRGREQAAVVAGLVTPFLVASVAGLGTDLHGADVSACVSLILFSIPLYASLAVVRSCGYRLVAPWDVFAPDVAGADQVSVNPPTPEVAAGHGDG